MGALEHPNVVPVYDVGVDAAGAPVIVMKRIEGRSWADLFQAAGGDRPPLRGGATHWSGTSASSSAPATPSHFHAHSRGILHPRSQASTT